MKSDIKVITLAQELVDEGAYSVFLYGSRVRGDALEDSDWEVATVYEETNYVSRSLLARRALAGMVIYPFKRNEFEAGNPAVPFTKSIWLAETIRTGKTIAGERFIEVQPVPVITTEDLRADVSFYKARALDAMIALRSGAVDLGKDLLVKSCLLGVRDLILLSDGKFPLSYDAIAAMGDQLLPDEFKRTLADIMQVRKGELAPSVVLAFANLDIFVKIIEPKLKSLK